ncbi:MULTISPECIES: helix-turn-helix domain-containing protein [unclassified Streptosporangium]|uniref:helix-turn-helix domain-containing protein n=1 Tax=unclassified Streptosporangium TaxID=2632669 RepID=UPI002E2DE254|nr:MULTISPECIES: helix-turn-helix transcriptional regulator [unclassified Streptosporangium]
MLVGMASASPTVRHRRLGRELRRLREKADLTLEEVATPLRWSTAKLSRIENARTMPSGTDVADLCDLYAVDPPTKAGLIQLGQDAGQRGWWTAYSDVFAGAYVGLESEATTIRTWEPLLVPGLLQNEVYARELIRTSRPGLVATELKRYVAARMARKISLLSSQAPVLHVLMDECALRRPVGSPGIMAHQLGDILQVMDWPNITVQVLPLRIGAHCGLEGAFSLLAFDTEDPEVGYTGCPGGDVYVEATDQVENLKLTFERLAGACLSPEESAAFIAAVRSDHAPL